MKLICLLLIVLLITSCTPSITDTQVIMYHNSRPNANFYTVLYIDSLLSSDEKKGIFVRANFLAYYVDTIRLANAVFLRESFLKINNKLGPSVCKDTGYNLVFIPKKDLRFVKGSYKDGKTIIAVINHNKYNCFLDTFMFERYIGNTKNVRKKILKEGFTYKHKIKN
jgi:hypothetical protein